MRVRTSAARAISSSPRSCADTTAGQSKGCVGGSDEGQRLQGRSRRTGSSHSRVFILSFSCDFSFFVRVCGWVYCGDCSPLRELLGVRPPQYKRGRDDPPSQLTAQIVQERVCDDCVGTIRVRAAAAARQANQSAAPPQSATRCSAERALRTRATTARTGSSSRAAGPAPCRWRARAAVSLPRCRPSCRRPRCTAK